MWTLRQRSRSGELSIFLKLKSIESETEKKPDPTGRHVLFAGRRQAGLASVCAQQARLRSLVLCIGRYARYVRLGVELAIDEVWQEKVQGWRKGAGSKIAVGPPIPIYIYREWQNPKSQRRCGARSSSPQPFDCRRALLPETVSTYDRLLVSVTLEKREGACALFVQKTPDIIVQYIYIYIFFFFLLALAARWLKLALAARWLKLAPAARWLFFFGCFLLALAARWIFFSFVGARCSLTEVCARCSLTFLFFFVGARCLLLDDFFFSLFVHNFSATQHSVFLRSADFVWHQCNFGSENGFLLVKLKNFSKASCLKHSLSVSCVANRHCLLYWLWLCSTSSGFFSRNCLVVYHCTCSWSITKSFTIDSFVTNSMYRKHRGRRKAYRIENAASQDASITWKNWVSIIKE